MINFFDLSTPGVRLVDLPGYGYAKVSLDLKAEWGKHLDDYLRNRQSLSGLVLIMDIRKPLTEFDTMLLDWSNQCQLPTIILLTKSDKLKYGPAKQVYFQVKKAMEEHESIVDVILFSSLKKSGITESRQTLNNVIQARFDAALNEENDLETAADDADIDDTYYGSQDDGDQDYEDQLHSGDES